MSRKLAFGALVATAALVAGIGGASAQEKIKIGFLPGVVDPFYQVMQIGVEKAAADLGIEVVTQIPPTWGVEAQTPILDAHGGPRRPRLHHHRADRQGPDDRPAPGGGRRRHQGDHRRHLPRRRRLRQRPGQVPDQLYRLGQRRGRPHLGPRPRQGDRRQGQRLHQLHQPQCQLGRGARQSASRR